MIRSEGFVRRGSRAFAFLAGVCGVGGCNSDSSKAEGTGGVPSSEFCEAEDDAPAFYQGWSLEGPAHFTFSIDEASPAPPTEGKNNWRVTVSGPDGAPVTDGRVCLHCRMETHNHDCGVVPEVTNLGNGLYEIKPIVLNMDKRWNIEVNVKMAAEKGYACRPTDVPDDRVFFPICVP